MYLGKFDLVPLVMFYYPDQWSRWLQVAAILIVKQEVAGLSVLYMCVISQSGSNTQALLL